MRNNLLDSDIKPTHEVSESGGSDSDNQKIDNHKPLPVDNGTSEVGINGIAPGIMPDIPPKEKDDPEGLEVKIKGVAPNLQRPEQKPMGVR